MTKMLENEMLTADPLDYAKPEPEFERDTSLVDTLRDIAGLSNEIDRIEGVIADLSKTVYAKRQAE